MQNNERQNYLAYMLRLWRASVESPHTSKRQAFASLELLIAFLRENVA